MTSTGIIGWSSSTTLWQRYCPSRRTFRRFHFLLLATLFLKYTTVTWTDQHLFDTIFRWLDFGRLRQVIFEKPYKRYIRIWIEVIEFCGQFSQLLSSSLYRTHYFCQNSLFSVCDKRRDLRTTDRQTVDELFIVYSLTSSFLEVNT